MIEVKNLTKCFGEKRAVDELSFTVRAGVAYGFLGRNGAGKTTTIRILMNVFREDSGEALFDGVPAHKESKRIGYLPEERGLYAKRGVLEQLVYFGMLKGMGRRHAEDEAHAKLGEMEASEYTHKKLETLSKGNQQKIQLAIALFGDPDVIILDEPFSGLDPINAQVLKNAVRRQVEEGRTVIFSSHQMAQVEAFCDDICIIDNGRAVLEGNLADIKRSYPRDLLYVEAEKGAAGMSSKPLDILLREQAYVEGAAAKGEGYVVKLTGPAKRSLLLRTLEEADARVDSFYVIEPTLEQIFVEKVGDAGGGSGGDPQGSAEAEQAPGKGPRKKGRSLFKDKRGRFI
ncbi:MAG: ATP-binding cassette domain-containing protein [Clostridiales Family XIII bacterium]|jgi:ABC-2 type transport system ATP-binding protein|nr:ATP-binding cassette domain-containing protein [Clostridiales Family XIII bacterium]